MELSELAARSSKEPDTMLFGSRAIVTPGVPAGVPGCVVPSSTTGAVIGGSGDCSGIVGVAPGMLNVIFPPAAPLASMMAWRRLPSPESFVFVTTNVPAADAPAGNPSSTSAAAIGNRRRSPALTFTPRFARPCAGRPIALAPQPLDRKHPGPAREHAPLPISCQ